MRIEEEKVLPKNFAEFFAGIGLMRMGLEQAGWEVKFANDIDPLKERLYTNHFKDPEPHFKLGNIHQIAGDEIPQVSLATASFPCTDLSLAGRREGLSGSQSSAFWGFIRILKEMEARRPKLVLLENVEGFLTSNQGKDFAEALLALNELGYAVDSFVIDAARFVPQSRVRLFIVGINQAGKSHNLEEGTYRFYQNEIRTGKLADFIFSNPTINWRIRQVPPLPQRHNRLDDLIEAFEDNAEEWWSNDRVEYLLNQTSERHLAKIEAAKSQPTYSYFTAFRRIRNGKSMAEIRTDGVAGCLRTPKGGSARQILVRTGKGHTKIRLLSARECARLMGADDFALSGTFNEALFGFGDAVCVPVVKWIAENYLNPVLEELNNRPKEKTLEYGKTATSSQHI